MGNCSGWSDDELVVVIALYRRNGFSLLDETHPARQRRKRGRGSGR